MHVALKDIPLSERPRERLINYGVDCLSNEELLALLLKTGTRNISVKELSTIILQKLDHIYDLKDVQLQTLTNLKGIGEAKACEIIAAIELGKRLNRKNSILKLKVTGAKDIYEYYQPLLENQKQEQFYCLYLDTHNQVIKDKLLYVGTINQSLIHPREIFKEAYLMSASSIVCLHNHPSGNISPSRADIEMTENIKQVSEILGIKLLDHIIIGEFYYSFLEHGLL